MIQLFFNVINSAGFIAICGAIAAMYKANKDAATQVQTHNDIMHRAQSFSTLETLEARASKHAQDEYISLEDKKRYHETYEIYKALGGNGYADSLMSMVDSLPIKEEA